MNTTPVWKKVLGIILNLFLGINFLLSAYAKLPSIEVFGWTIAESTPFNWTISEWLARLVIGLEIFLGILFIFQLLIKKIAIPLSTALIVFFSLYLIYILSAYGNEPNCGCYGEMIPLSTTESLIKNGFILILLFVTWLFRFEFRFRFHKLVALILCIGAFALPIYLSPPTSIVIFDKDEIENEIVPLHLISSDKNYLNDKKKIVAMISPTCKYCKKAAKRMGIIKSRHPEVPFLFVMSGHRDHLQDFLDQTRADNIPLVFMDSMDQFMLVNNRPGVPTIKWLEDSTVVKTSSYFSLSENEILDWIKK